MAFKDLGDWSLIGGLELPIGGKVYKLPAVSAALGPRLQAVVTFGIEVNNGKSELTDDDQVVLDDMAEVDLYKAILHPCGDECGAPEDAVCPRDVYAEMMADRVPWPALKHAAMTAMFDAVFDRETAEQYWETLGKAPAQNRATRRASKPTAAAIKAKKPASTGATTSRRSTSAKAKATTAGRKSSSTGRS